MAPGVVDRLQAVHINGNDRGDPFRVPVDVRVVRLPVEQARQRVLFRHFIDGEDMVDIQHDRDRRAEDLQVRPAVNEGQEQAHRKDEAKESGLNGLSLLPPAAPEQDHDQGSAVQPYHYKGKIPQRAALQRSVLPVGEHDPGEKRDQVDPRVGDRGNIDLPPAGLPGQGEDNERDNEGRDAVPDPRQEDQEVPHLSPSGQPGFDKHGKGQQEQRDDQHNVPPDGNAVDKHSRLQ